ncbi:MAG: hypothetical protein IJU79_03955 [Desulfovibrionaceae bacterium]|nr:hypothetical protein [Desulfovibrionaceae bacterium]
MRGLFQHLTPLAPDQSGAIACLYELEGLVVICDAGGCTGNICGFDEPRWLRHKSAIFSAGLRDMDAILGRDAQLIAKIAQIAADFKPKFVALIGTPVPAVIATDFQGLTRLGEKKLGLPVLSVHTCGTKLYDTGMNQAYLALAHKFLQKEQKPAKTNLEIHLLGATPLDLGLIDPCPLIKAYAVKYAQPKYAQVYAQGFGSGFATFCSLKDSQENIVLSPGALDLAIYCKTTFGTPYRFDYPLSLLGPYWPKILENLENKRNILIVHQQVLGASLRNHIEKTYANTQVIVGTFFNQCQELTRPQDPHFTDEASFASYIQHQSFDLIIADEILKRVPTTSQLWLDLPHFAMSGRLLDLSTI